MKKIVSLALAAAMAASGDIVADYQAGEKSADLMTPEVQAAAAALLGPEIASNLLHAVRLNMAKYDADMQGQSGRRAWHGRLIREELYTNDLCKVEVYSNETTGATWRYRMPFNPPALQPSFKVKRVASTNGVPAALARARAKRVEELNQPTQTVSVVVGGGT